MTVLKTSAKESTQLILNNLLEKGKVLALRKLMHPEQVYINRHTKPLLDGDVLYNITKYLNEEADPAQTSIFLEKGEDEEHITVYYPSLLKEITLKKDTVVTPNSFGNLFAYRLTTKITVEELMFCLAENTLYSLCSERDYPECRTYEYLNYPTYLEMSVCEKAYLPDRQLEDTNGEIIKILRQKYF